MDESVDEIYEKVMISGIFEQGIEQGMEEGFEQGANNMMAETVRTLDGKGFDAVSISELLDFDLNFVQNIL